MKELENLRDVPYRYNTDLGNALSYAMMLVMNRRDQSNAPMIIALTDGANFISKEGNAKNYDSQEVYLWDADSNTYRTAIVKDYGKDNNNSSSNRDINGRALIVNSDTQQADAVEAARVNQVPIYTIALKGNANTASSRNEIRSFVDTLKQMADTTGGQCIETDFGNAHDLPTAFGKLFANQIGSSLLEQLSPVRETGRTYRVDIPILNNSVHEANIYIPLENIDVSSIKLTNADGEDRTYTQADVTRLESSNRFILYKIHAPRSVGGDWVLRFDLKDSALSVSDISFNLLYSYDIALKTSIGTGYSSMLEHGQGITIAKSDTLYISSSFYTKDASGADVPSKDTNLYMVHEDEPDWYTIHATYVFLNEEGEEVFGGRLVAHEQNRAFELELDLSRVYTSEMGYNLISEGEYTLRIVVDGAGIHRENMIPVTLTNTPPAQRTGMKITLRVNDVNDSRSWSTQQNELDLYAYVEDVDNDRLSFEFKPVSGSDIVRIHTVNNSDGTVSAAYETVADSTGGKVKAGTARYTLVATDHPDRQSESWDFEFDVISVADSMLSDFTCYTASKDIDASSTAEKNSDIQFAMNLVKNGVADNTGAIRDFTGTMDVFNASNLSQPLATVDMTLSDDGTRLEAAYHTGNREADLVAKFTYKYGELYAPEQTIPFTVTNTAPTHKTSEVDSIIRQIKFNPLPDLISFIDPITPVEQRMVDLSVLFEDADNELGLEYDDPFISGQNLSFQRTGDTVELVPQNGGKAEITLTARDGDGETASFTVEIHIENVLQKWLLMLAAAVALIVLIIAIALASRPRFKPGTTLSVRVNAALQADQICDTIPRTQQKLLLSRYVDYETAARGGVTPEDLAQLSMKPMRCRTGSVLLLRAKGRSMISVQMDGTETGKKPVVWCPEAELTIRHSSDETRCIRITLSMQDSFGAGASMENSDWTNTSFDSAPSFTQGPSSGNSGSTSGDFEW